MVCAMAPSPKAISQKGSQVPVEPGSHPGSSRTQDRVWPWHQAQGAPPSKRVRDADSQPAGPGLRWWEQGMETCVRPWGPFNSGGRRPRWGPCPTFQSGNAHEDKGETGWWQRGVHVGSRVRRCPVRGPLEEGWREAKDAFPGWELPGKPAAGHGA